MVNQKARTEEGKEEEVRSHMKMNSRTVSGVRWQADYTHSCQPDWGLGWVCLLGKAVSLEMSKTLRNHVPSLNEISHVSVFIELETQRRENKKLAMEDCL